MEEEDFNTLSLVCSAVGQSKTVFPEYSAAEIDRLKEKFAKLQSKALQIQKPLIQVTLLPDKIQNYVKLLNIVREFATREMSVEHTLSQDGDIELIVCGDVHLDLCVDSLRKLCDFQFHIGQVHLQVFETVVSQTQTQFGAYFGVEKSQLDEILTNYSYNVQQFLGDEEQTFEQRALNYPKLTLAE